jgi:hypothetical protein
LPLPRKLGDSKRHLVLACTLPSIHGYNFKVMRLVQLPPFFEVDRVLVLLCYHVNVEQHVHVKFCERIGNSATETYDLLNKVYGDECLSRTQVSK